MRERLTTEKTKIFARENPTLMSMTKGELRRHYNEIFDRLQEYEVAEENSQIIMPPCKVGNVVYYVARNSGNPIGTIDEVKIVMIGKTESGWCAKGKIGESTFDIYPHFEIDNYTFYASREKAKKSLNADSEG